MSSTLISVTNLTEWNHILQFEKEWCNILGPNGKLVRRAKRGLGGDKLYHLAAEPYTAASISMPTFSALHSSTNINTLHHCLGHLNFNSIQKLVDANMLSDDTSYSGKEEFCEACALGKVHRNPFPLSTSTTSEQLELIHSNICRPLTTSIGGWKYFTLFIDDYSRMKFIYFLKNKDCVLKAFKDFKTSAKKETSLQIKCLHSDNGGEYTSNPFSNFLRSEGITHQTTTPYSPEQNGQSECGNQTIVEKIRPMLVKAKLSHGFWSEAAQFAIHVANCSPHASLNNQTPFELWHGKKPVAYNLQAFGSIAYAHIDKSLQKKLDPKADKC